MFNFFKKAPKDDVSNTPVQGNATPSTTNQSSSAKVSLTKAKVSLDKHIVSLQKEKNIDLSNHHARVFVVLDRSGSMSPLYRKGSVQETLTRLLPLALKFDDDGELDVYVFNEKCDQLPSMNLKNYETYVKNVIMRNGYEPEGGTRYAPAIKKTVSNYNDKNPYPAFGLFITDGDAWDKADTDEAIRESANYKLFYQFIGIGSENFSYLQKLDDLTGRKVDNTAFCRVSDFASLTDDQLYDKLLEQYPDWLKAMHIN